MNKLQVLDNTSIVFDAKLFNATAMDLYNAPYWVEFVEPHFNQIGIDIDVLPLSSIDKTKPWLINLDVLMHNWEPVDDIFASLGDVLLNDITHGNAYLILNHQCESFTVLFFDLLYRKLKAFPRIPYNKIIYMVAAADAHREYDNFAKGNRLTEEQKIRIMYAHHVYKRNLGPDNSVLSFFNYMTSTSKQKKFLSLNRMPHPHRVILVTLLAQHNLLKHGYVSLGLMGEQIKQTEFNLNSMLFPNDQLEQVMAGYSIIKPNLPLQIDAVDLNVNQFKVNSLPINFYQDSYFSLVTSTFAFGPRERAVGFTEKEIKPILARHPFIIFNLPGVLAHLKSMGFMTFDRWFDESYDRELDDWDRVTKIVKEVKRLSELSFEEWDSIRNDMIPVLEHNYNRLVNYRTEHCYFNSDLKEFLHYVTE